MNTVTFFERFRPHHQELRKRLLRVFLVITVSTALAYFFIDHLAFFCTQPLFLAAPNLEKLVYTKLTDAFISYIKLALLTGIIISFPYLLYQGWMFIAPGLLKKERIIVRRIIFWSTGLFTGGVLFAFFIVLPNVLSFFMSYAGENLVPMPKLGLYLTFVGRMVLAFAISFEIPFLMVMATSVGLVGHDYFTTQRKYFYIAIVVLSFLLTAGEVTATVLLSFPLFILYEAGIFAGRIFTKSQHLS
ncbi:MAG: twin-arginine translocase subunit TatC [Candidatus Electrothrix sp. AW2]|jgi:sec-independent protein translocase protein TatC|nr:twin-arginine translocase subunit TatC [Candidatus Electrothrix sp. AX1]MCI5117941.1 twin-arginine translocase subunit TatC [Candidatus Electrothrix gigas]MCI5133477.1 twin-arginine translocase subunit TatC [Candidatus Electrothrix gigas]MCI5180148.1 twin-arginine translocase subunit TatC [Candidatus Electrothrix gigas]MCI5181259.1 twin-arginine translocase subunit TatC [Candidatus Electrothrix gigas]